MRLRIGSTAATILFTVAAVSIWSEGKANAGRDTPETH